MPKRKLRCGLSLEEYEAKWTAQGSACAICGRQPKPGQRRYAVDHDHKSGRVRGILCWFCNRGLGYFMDRPWVLDVAAAYLRTHGH